MRGDEGRSGGAGREAIVAGVADALRCATLEELARFVTYEQISRRAFVSKGTVTYHFSDRESMVDEVVEALVAAVVERLGAGSSLGALRLARSGDTTTEARSWDVVLTALEGLFRAGSGEAFPFEGDYTLLLGLLGAAAGTDPRAGDLLGRLTTAAGTWHTTLGGQLARLTLRGWTDVGGAQQFGAAARALVDGELLAARRADTPSARVDLARNWLRLFLAFTDGRDGSAAATLDLIVASRSEPPTAEQRARMAAAALRIHGHAGWRGLTVPAVAHESGLPAPLVTRIARGRRGLASAVWSSNVPTLWRAAHALGRHVDGREALRCFTEQVADMAKARPEVSRAFLDDVWAYSLEHGAPRGAIEDPRGPVPLPAMFEHLLAAHAASFRPELDEPGERSDVATALTNLTLLTCLSHPEAPVAAIAELVMRTTVDGLARAGTGHADGGDGPGDEAS